MSVSDNKKKFSSEHKDPLDAQLSTWQESRFHLLDSTRSLADNWEFAAMLPVYFSEIALQLQSKFYTVTLAFDLVSLVGQSSKTGQEALSWVLDQAEENIRAGKGIKSSNNDIISVYCYANPGSALEKRAAALLPRSKIYSDQINRLRTHKLQLFLAHIEPQLTCQPPTPGIDEVP
ncbi:MAG TPA: hypothetical protein DEA55_08090 [Rhodospirillaceae bacterium]|nr:hypothetical protein [Rhodospirillaceae bacterium]